MKYIRLFNIKSLWLLLVVACSQDDDAFQIGSGPWSIPRNQVITVQGFDAIPSLVDPQMLPAAEALFMKDDELIIGYRNGGDIRAYPHHILDYHEIVNDDLSGEMVAITYCPLTGTAIGWPREFDGREVDFGVSGMLYNSNLIPYDRSTASIWSQMLMQSVNGFFIGKEVQTFSLVETTYLNWKTMYPNTKVLSRATGSNRAYDRYPYVGRTGDMDYRTDPFLIFPISRDDRRLPRKERTLGVFVGNKIKAFRFRSFPGSEVTIFQQNFEGVDIVVAGSEDRNFMLAFQSILEDGTALTFTPINDPNSSLIMSDNEGNEWDVFGEALTGPRIGERLVPIRSFIGFWFTWETFYPGVVIHEFDG